MGMPFLLGTDYLRKIQSVRPQNLVALWPQNEPSGAVSTEIVRRYNGAYTGVTLGGVGVQGTGLTSAGYDGATSYNNIYSAGLANDNLLLNPGFETAGAGDPDFWANYTETAGDGALANEIVIVHQGVDSCKMTSGATSNTNVFSDAMVVIPGARRRFRFFTYGDGVNAGRYAIYDITNGAYITPITSTGITAAAWGMVAPQFTVPAGCISARVEYWCPPVNGGVCYFDAGEFRRMDGFLGDEGTILVPAQVANVGVWTDATARSMVHIGVDANNYIDIGRTVANNTIGFDYVAGGTAETQATAALANLDFATYGMTWSKSGDAVKYYIGGVASGATDTGLGTWLGNLSNTGTVIGTQSTLLIDVWSGPIGPVPYWSAALSPDEMRYLG